MPDKLPTIKVGWDAEQQVPVVEFERDEFKTWDMVLMVLGAAIEDAKFRMNLIRMASIQQQQQQAMQQQIIAQQKAQSIQGHVLRGR